ncbi:hypothetical protein VAWG002_31470 [Aeromonas veronii]|nr:hypothetical protein VAWG002_31470 [Aeromonas veronii]
MADGPWRPPFQVYMGTAHNYMGAARTGIKARIGQTRMEVLLFTTNQGKAEPAVYRVIHCLCRSQTAAAPVGAAVW